MEGWPGESVGQHRKARETGAWLGRRAFWSDWKPLEASYRRKGVWPHVYEGQGWGLQEQQTELQSDTPSLAITTSTTVSI